MACQTCYEVYKVGTMSGEAAAFDEKLEVPTNDFAEGGTTLASNASPNSGT